MNLKALSKTQEKLDEHIIKEKGLQGVDLLDKKILALQVELGELANELPEVFKFWSDKKNDYEKALVEYVDALHFILSIGNDLDINDYDNYVTPQEDNIIDAFLSVFEFVNTLDVHQSTDDYYQAFARFVNLGSMLGFTWGQVEDAYYKKNEVNHARQHSGY